MIASCLWCKVEKTQLWSIQLFQYFINDSVLCMFWFSSFQVWHDMKSWQSNRAEQRRKVSVFHFSMNTCILFLYGMFCACYVSGVLVVSDEDDSRRGTLLRKWMGLANRVSVTIVGLIFTMHTLLYSVSDFTCRNGLIAVPTVNKDFSCCETTQQKVGKHWMNALELYNLMWCFSLFQIQVPGVDREMCLKKEFYYCDSTLQKQGK